jgi:hypothetical protein
VRFALSRRAAQLPGARADRLAGLGAAARRADDRAGQRRRRGGTLAAAASMPRSGWSASSRALRAAVVARTMTEEREPLAGLARIDLEIERREPAAAEPSPGRGAGTSPPGRTGGV